MFRPTRIRFVHIVIYSLLISFLWIGPTGPQTAVVRADDPPVQFDGEDGKDRSKKKKKKKKKSKKKIRWGQRLGESNKEYDKRYARVYKRAKREKRNDFEGGIIIGGDGEPARMWRYMGHPGCPFICRTDIDKEFTANLAMYMESIHREYSRAWKLLAQQPSTFKEKVEVIVYADPQTYFRNGGMPGSGGMFTAFANFYSDRGPAWPARHFRLVQFTDDIRDFAKWPKGTLKHEAAHMELQCRLGFTISDRMTGSKTALAVRAPLWWNEGQATIFEDWDLGKSVEENFAEIPKRGRYVPLIRRLYDSENWKDFTYIWEIEPRSWHAEPGFRVYLNYAQSWSLVGYMMNQGLEGRRDFRKIFDLSRRVGANEQRWRGTAITGKNAWLDVFPEEDLERMEKNWGKWVAENVPKDGRIPDEEYSLRRSGIDPSFEDGLEPFDTRAEREENQQWVEKEKNRRRKSTTVEW